MKIVPILHIRNEDIVFHADWNLEFSVESRAFVINSISLIPTYEQEKDTRLSTKLFGNSNRHWKHSHDDIGVGSDVVRNVL